MKGIAEQPYIVIIILYEGTIRTISFFLPIFVDAKLFINSLFRMG